MDPENTACRNLVHNPYLARDLNFIGGRYRKAWVPLANVTLSDRNPKFGERCLRIKAKSFSYIDLATISVEPGDYTVSLYARSEQKASFYIVLGGHRWGTSDYTRKQFSNVPSQWKRYELTVHVPAVSALRFTVGVTSNKPDSAVYFDGFQLERGKKATEFTANPVSAQLLTSAPDDFIRSGSPINARLRLSSRKKQVSGKVKITVMDMFDTVLAEKESCFKFGEQEHPVIPLELDGKIPDGVHRVRAEFEADGKKYTEYSRFSVMPFIRNQHKLKNMFSLEYTGKRVYMDVYPGLETYIRRCMHLGADAAICV